MFSQFVLLKAASKLSANFSQVFTSSLPNLNILERTNVLLRSIFFDFNKSENKKVTSIHIQYLGHMIFLLVCVKSLLPVDGLLWLQLYLNFDRVAYFLQLFCSISISENAYNPNISIPFIATVSHYS